MLDFIAISMNSITDVSNGYLLKDIVWQGDDYAWKRGV